MERNAVVVGAGVGGLCTAIGLRDAGWRVTVLERWPHVTGIGAGIGVGIGVWPDAQAVLDRLGVGEAFRDVAIEFGAGGVFTRAGRRLCAVPSGRVERRAGVPIRILARSALIDLLAHDVKAGCDVRTGVEVRAEHVIGADLVVGADGLRSTVRPMFFGSASTPTGTGYVAWRGRVARELDDDAHGETWGPGALAGLTRLSPGVTNWYVALDDDTTDLDEVRDRVRDWRHPIPGVLADTDPGTVLRHPIEELRPHLASYVTDRVALLGDAAHAMTPNLGRGACEAIIDATTLVDAVRDEDVAAGLAVYDRARRRPTQKVVDRSRTALSVATARRTGLRDTVISAASPFIR